MEGVGLVAELDAQGGCRVKTVKPGMPAAASPLRSGDELLRVDGRDLQGMSLAQAMTLLTGPPGSLVSVNARSARSGSRFTVRLQRRSSSAEQCVDPPQERAAPPGQGLPDGDNEAFAAERVSCNQGFRQQNRGSPSPQQPDQHNMLSGMPDQEVERQRSTHMSELDRARLQVSSAEEKFQAAQAALHVLRAQHSDLLHQKQAIESRLSSQIHELKEAHLDALNELGKQNQDQILMLHKEIEDKDRAREQEQRAMMLCHEKRVSALQAKLQQGGLLLERTKEDLRTQSEREIEKLKREQSKIIHDLSVVHEQAVHDLESRYQKQIMQLKDDSDKIDNRTKREQRSILKDYDARLAFLQSQLDGEKLKTANAKEELTMMQKSVEKTQDAVKEQRIALIQESKTLLTNVASMNAIVADLIHSSSVESAWQGSDAAEVMQICSIHTERCRIQYQQGDPGQHIGIVSATSSSKRKIQSALDEVVEGSKKTENVSCVRMSLEREIKRLQHELTQANTARDTLLETVQLQSQELVSRRDLSSPDAEHSTPLILQEQDQKTLEDKESILHALSNTQSELEKSEDARDDLLRTVQMQEIEIIRLKDDIGRISSTCEDEADQRNRWEKECKILHGMVQDKDIVILKQGEELKLEVTTREGLMEELQQMTIQSDVITRLRDENSKLRNELNRVMTAKATILMELETQNNMAIQMTQKLARYEREDTLATFARERASEIDAKKRMQHSVWTLKQNVAKMKEGDRRSRRHKERITRNRCRLCLVAWFHLANEGSRQRNVMKIAMLRMMGKSFLSAFCAWNDETKKRIREKMITSRILRQWIYHTILFACETWRIRTQKQKKLRTKVLRILQRFENRQLFAAFVMYQDRVNEKKRVELICSKIIARWSSGRICSAFFTWQAQGKAQRRARDVCLRVLRRVCNKTLSCAFKTWGFQAKQLRRQQKILQRVTLKMNSRLLAAAFEHYRNNVILQFKLAYTGKKVVMRWIRISCARAFDMWQKQARACLRMKHVCFRIVRRMIHFTLSCSFLMWSTNARETRRQKDILDGVLARWSNRTVVSGFDKWRVTVIEQKHHRYIFGKVFAKWENHILFSAFHSWQSEHRKLKIIEGILERWMHLALARAFQRLQMNASGAKKSRIEMCVEALFQVQDECLAALECCQHSGLKRLSHLKEHMSRSFSEARSRIEELETACESEKERAESLQKLVEREKKDCADLEHALDNASRRILQTESRLQKMTAFSQKLQERLEWQRLGYVDYDHELRSASSGNSCLLQTAENKEDSIAGKTSPEGPFLKGDNLSYDRLQPETEKNPPVQSTKEIMRCSNGGSNVEEESEKVVSSSAVAGASGDSSAQPQFESGEETDKDSLTASISHFTAESSTFILQNVLHEHQQLSALAAVDRDSKRVLALALAQETLSNHHNNSSEL